MQLEDIISDQNFEPVSPLRNQQPFTLYSLLFVVPTGSPRPYNRPPRGISASSRRGRSDSAPSEGVVEIAVQTTVARFVVCWAAVSRIWSEFIRKALAGELTVGRACERGQEHFVPRWLITRLGQGEEHGRGGFDGTVKLPILSELLGMICGIVLTRTCPWRERGKSTGL